MIAVTAAAMLTAVVTFTMVVVMMVALHIGVICQLVVQKSLYSRIRVAADTTIQLDAGSSQCHLRSAANTTTDQHIRIQCGQYTGPSAMAAALGVYDLGIHDLPVLDVVYLKLLCVSKMLEDLFIFISYCDSHNVLSFVVIEPIAVMVLV